MNGISTPLERPSRLPHSPLVAVGSMTGIALLVLFAWKVGPLPATALAALALGGIALVAAPSAGVLAAIFLIYANLPVVAHQQELIPRPVAALVAVLFLPLLVRELVLRRAALRLDRTFVLLGAFLAIKAISALMAVDPGLALAAIGAYATEGVAIFVLVLNTVRDRPGLQRAMVAVLLAGSLLAGLTAYQSVARDYDRDFGGLAQRSLEHVEGERAVPRAEMGRADRAHGPVDEPNRFAQILLMASPFALYFVWMRTGGRRALAAASGVILLAGVLLTYSRGAFVALVALLLALRVMGCLRSSHLVTVLLVGALLVPLVARGYVDRVQSIFGVYGMVSQDASVEPDGPTRGRTTEMLAALLAYSEHPILGVGPGQYTPHHSVRYQLRPEIAFREIPEPRRSHSLYLEVAAETGTVGLLVFLAIPGLLLRDLRRLRERARDVRPDLERLSVVFILSMLAYLGTGVFLHLAFQRYYWLLVAMTAAAARVIRDELEREATSCSGS